MDTIETFDFNELKICSNELKKINRGKPYGSYKASTAIPSSKPEDFKLIKESKNYENVYRKIYMNSTEKPKCL